MRIVSKPPSDREPRGFVTGNPEVADDDLMCPPSVPTLPPEKVAKVILRAAKEGKVEYYIPYSERILSSFALLFPALIPTIYPWFEEMGVKRQKAYLATRQRRTAGRHADPGARTGGDHICTIQDIVKRVLFNEDPAAAPPRQIVD